MNVTAINQELVRIEAALDAVRRLTTPNPEITAADMLEYLGTVLARAKVDGENFQYRAGHRKSYANQYNALLGTINTLLFDLRLFDQGLTPDVLAGYLAKRNPKTV
jgi:hypothetical protein